ncbi:alkaline phosphatase PhoX [Brevundimonas sp. SORGH_AS_0993]|uniref:alkaline phosphatase PhoX n=1 Tax=Brevundimonas sp. SORGH_AS_0993 TaxID=3041794 RepID=UPI00278A6042|nr:alkaline phosphatase PhoX [Brevundimonas sp. SORGH_AS_0993]MDQ1153506.1 secreted PhoX family phosphatase [Brevundimonas sp. SORGH_AS_0993]
MFLHRRALIGSSAALAFSGLARNVHAAAEETYLNEVEGYGPLKRDPNGLLDLPEGFSYRIVSQGGETMADGLLVPGQFDGMGCFALDSSRVALVRNHELKGSSSAHRHWGPGGYNQQRIDRLDASRAYDTYKDGRPLPGGTTTVIYDLASGETERQHLSLAGTSTNCCGGPTPWGSWLTCEETEETPADADVTKAHGYVFEVPARAEGLVDPIPLTALGRFDHEAVCVDPRTGVVYLTEDRPDGLFYRFIPDAPGELVKGGRLQAMVLRARKAADTANHQDRLWSVGDWLDVDWIDMAEVESPRGDLRQRGHADGAALVARGEGIWWGDGELYLTATSGGPIQRGQILRYVPSPDEGRASEARRPGRLQLFVESTNEKTLNMGDNITVAPWGHLIVCEDNYSSDIKNHLKGVAPDGKIYTLGRNMFQGNSEFAGAVFSPDGSTLFVNIQYPGMTLAITGPWNAVRI